MRYPKKMPSYLPRDFDIVPPLGLQGGALDENLELYYLRAVASIQEEKFAPRQVKTAYGVIKALPATMNKVIYEVGEPFPINGQNPIPQRELMKDVVSKMGNVVMLPDGRKEYPDIIIKQRGVSEKIPKTVEDLNQFQGSEFVHYFQHAYGSQYRNIARKFHIKGLMDPYRIAKNELLNYNIIKSWSSPVLWKIRSTLLTEAIGTDTIGWSRMGAGDVLTLEQALTSNKWWRDIAVSEPVNIDGLQGHIYRALRQKKRIAI